MAVNILTYLKDQFTPTVIDQLGHQLNETPANVRLAVNGAVPVVLGAVAQQAQSGGWAGGLLKSLQAETHSMTENPLDIGQVTDTPAETKTALSAGRAFLDRVLGQNVTTTADGLARFSNLKPDSALTVLSLAGAALMGLLTRQANVNGMSAENLKTLLAGQADTIRTALPAGLASVGATLGLDQLRTPTGKTNAQGLTNFSGTPLNPNIPKSGEYDRVRENNRFLLPALAAVGLLVLALLLERCQEPKASTTTVVTDTASRTEATTPIDTLAATLPTTTDSIAPTNAPMADATSDTVGQRAPAVAEKPAVEVQMELPGGRKIGVVANTFNYNVATFLASKPKNPNRTFTFENLTFDTNSAKITTRSQPNVTDLTQVMLAYPSLQIRIEGHTDNTGNAAKNQELSARRASAIKAALVTQGIAASRISTQGFGASRPTATNNTEAGRQKNRRIDAAITKL